MDAVVDRFVVGRTHEKAIKAGIAATLLVGDGLIQIDTATAVHTPHQLLARVVIGSPGGTSA